MTPMLNESDAYWLLRLIIAAEPTPIFDQLLAEWRTA